MSMPHEPASDFKIETSSDRVSSPLASSPHSSQHISPPQNEQPKQPRPTPSEIPANCMRPLHEVIEETFPPFDHQGVVVTPFTEESNRDFVFEQELSAMLLDVIIETQAWASSRPKHETQAAIQRFEQKISAVMDVEKEQGMFPPHPSSSHILPSHQLSVVEKTRKRLNEFVTRMKTALAALTGLGI